MGKKENPEIVSNRKAFHDYEILDTYETGIVLKGTEVKSLKNHSCSLKDSYVTIKKDELFLIGSHIAHYSFGNLFNHEEVRDRKLLMHKNEILKLKKMVQEKGITLVPISIYMKKGRIKVAIAAAKGKKKYEKREALKEREQKKEIERALKER